MHNLTAFVSSMAVVTYALLATGCGGNLVPPQPIPTVFSGRWVGAASVAIGTEAPRGYDALTTIVASGEVAHLGGLCPDGSGEIEMISFEEQLGWQGDVLCQPTWLGGCMVTLRYAFAKATVSPDRVLTIEAKGTAERTPLTSDCGDAPPVSYHFTGVRG